VTVCANTFEGFSGAALQLGVIESANDVTVEANEFHDSDSAIFTKASDVTIRRNLLDDADMGIESEGAEIHNNSFVNADAGIFGDAPADATLNHWNSTDGPSGDGPGSGTPLELASHLEVGGGCPDRALA
jgi:hypothetical protein